MPRYDSKADHVSQCTSLTQEGVRCPNIVHDPIDGKMLCHIHHPSMPYQKQQALRNGIWDAAKELYPDVF